MSFCSDTYPGTRDACEAGYTFEPRDPRGVPIGATVTVRGPDSQAVLDHLQARMDEDRQAELDAARRGKPAEPLTLAQMEARAVQLAVAYTLTWDGFVDAAKAPLPPTPAHLADVYRRHGWLRRQVIDEGSTLGNFLPALSASSSSTPGPSTD